MDERLSCYALIARASIDVTIPLLIRVFSQRVARLNQVGFIFEESAGSSVHFFLMIIKN